MAVGMRHAGPGLYYLALGRVAICPGTNTRNETADQSGGYESKLVSTTAPRLQWRKLPAGGARVPLFMPVHLGVVPPSTRHSADRYQFTGDGGKLLPRGIDSQVLDLRGHLCMAGSGSKRRQSLQMQLLKARTVSRLLNVR